MRTNTTKDEFISHLQSKIERREELVKFYNDVFLPTLKKFDGKVYNKRFITALQNCCNSRMVVRDMEYQRIAIEYRKTDIYYSEYETMSVRVHLDDKRISYEETINLNNMCGYNLIESFEKTTNEMRDSIANYETYLEISKETQAAIDKFVKIPFEFRQHICFGGTHYLK